MQKGGFIAITTVLLISAVVLATAVSAALLGIGQAQSSFAQTKGETTLNFVEGCTEDALLKLRASSFYTGGTITRPEGSCLVTVSGVSSVYTLTVTTTASDYKRTIQAIVTKGSAGLTLGSWKEN